MIPPDDYPGAWDAGVGEYILRQLRGDLEPLNATYSEGLDALDREADAQFGVPFQQLGPDQQDGLLQKLEVGKTQVEWTVPAAHFVSLLIQHSAEGYYADPENGGNKGARSWQMIGFTPADDETPGVIKGLSESMKAYR